MQPKRRNAFLIGGATVECLLSAIAGAAWATPIYGALGLLYYGQTPPPWVQNPRTLVAILGSSGLVFGLASFRFWPVASGGTEGGGRFRLVLGRVLAIPILVLALLLGFFSSFGSVPAFHFKAASALCLIFAMLVIFLPTRGAASTPKAIFAVSGRAVLSATLIFLFATVPSARRALQDRRDSAGSTPEESLQKYIDRQFPDAKGQPLVEMQKYSISPQSPDDGERVGFTAKLINGREMQVDFVFNEGRWRFCSARIGPKGTLSRYPAWWAEKAVKISDENTSASARTRDQR